MARHHIREVAVEEVCHSMVGEEMDKASSKEGGFHFPEEKCCWAVLDAFNMSCELRLIQKGAPTLLRILIAAVTPNNTRPKAAITEDG